MFVSRNATALALAITVATVAACSRRDARADDPPPVTVEQAPDDTVITVPHPEQFPLISVAMRDVHPQLSVTGAVAPDSSRDVPVTSLSAGRVIDLRVRLGDNVRRGQVLLTLSSPDVAQAAADVRKFQADADLARRALERARVLHDHEALAGKDLEAAVNADEKAQTDLIAAQERLRLFGADPEHPSPIVVLRAPVSGTIVEQNVTANAAVKSLDNSPNLFTIADLSRVWVLCDIYENNLGDVDVGDSAQVTLNAFPDRPLAARVANISRVLDPVTRTAKVRLELANRDGLLRPGMFATVLFTSERTERRAVVPASAIFRLHDRDWAFVPEGTSRFRRVEIRPAPPTRDGSQPIVGGLRDGDRVVANALQLSGASEP